MVHLAEYRLVISGARAGGGDRGAAVSRHRQKARGSALPAGAGVVHSGLHRARHLSLSQYCSAGHQLHGSRRTGVQPEISARRRRRAYSTNSHLYRLRLLGFPRQDPRRRGIPLNVSRGAKRLLWFAGLWAGGVVCVLALAYGVRILMGLG